MLNKMQKEITILLFNGKEAKISPTLVDNGGVKVVVEPNQPLANKI